MSRITTPQQTTSQPNEERRASRSIQEWVECLEDEGRTVLATELSTLTAIYGEESITCHQTTTTDILLLVRISLSSVEMDQEVHVRVEIRVQEHYPQSSSPSFKLISRYAGGYRIDSGIEDRVKKLYDDDEQKELARDEGVLFDGLETIKELVTDHYYARAAEQSHEVPGVIDSEHVVSGGVEGGAHEAFKIFVSEPIVDRKSVFVGHATRLTDPHQVSEIMAQILSDKKVARATHNMFAWRCEINGHIHQDNDDDGESAAGSRMQHLLNIMDVKNVLVCVSRWFGGIHLGADRFKHINQATRDALTTAKFIGSSAPESFPSSRADRKRH